MMDRPSKRRARGWAKKNDNRRRKRKHKREGKRRGGWRHYAESKKKVCCHHLNPLDLNLILLLFLSVSLKEEISYGRSWSAWRRTSTGQTNQAAAPIHSNHIHNHLGHSKRQFACRLVFREYLQVLLDFGDSSLRVLTPAYLKYSSLLSFETPFKLADLERGFGEHPPPEGKLPPLPRGTKFPRIAKFFFCPKKQLDWEVVCTLHQNILKALLEDRKETEEEDEEVAVYSNDNIPRMPGRPSAAKQVERKFLYFNDLSSLPMNSSTWPEILFQVFFAFPFYFLFVFLSLSFSFSFPFPCFLFWLPIYCFFLLSLFVCFSDSLSFFPFPSIYESMN